MLIDYECPADPDFVSRTIERISQVYLFCEKYVIGKSLLGRDIELLKIGNGKKKVMFVGGVHGSEHLTSSLLLRFAADYASAADDGGKVYSLSMRYLYENRTVYILPQLNPDGADIAIHGPSRDCPLYERIMHMCPDKDFTHWQANARGVDLNHNFSADFEKYKAIERQKGIFEGATKFSGECPESEKETKAICDFLRCADVGMLLAFHTQGEEIYYEANGACPPMGRAIGSAMARMCGYRLALPQGGARYGGLKDWFIKEFSRPGFTVECGKGENPLPYEDLFRIYAILREMLFTSVVLI